MEEVTPTEKRTPHRMRVEVWWDVEATDPYEAVHLAFGRLSNPSGCTVRGHDEYYRTFTWEECAKAVVLGDA